MPDSLCGSKPNIVFFFTDDQGWGDLEAFGHPYLKTPNLSRLAMEGTSFTQFYVASPVCSPSRVGALTGHCPARHHIHWYLGGPVHNRACGMPNWLDPQVTTVADLLKSAGYATAHFGKWHLSGNFGTAHHPAPEMQNAPLPSEYGFDEFGTRQSRDDWNEQADPYFRAHSTGIFVDEALRFIQAHRAQPFYVNIWTLIPHSKLRPTPEELAEYAGLVVDPERFPGYMGNYAREAPDLDSRAQTYFAAVTGLDKAVGRLLDRLEEMGLRENTLIIFASDNGPADYRVEHDACMGSPGPFRARKQSSYEGGIRTPCIVSWPGKVPSGRADSGSVISALDLLPTLSSLAGVPYEETAPDGEDVSDILLGHSRARTKALFWDWRHPMVAEPQFKPPQLAVRHGEWKLLMEADGSHQELYNVVLDPGERRDLAGTHPELVARLAKKALDWHKTLPPDAVAEDGSAVQPEV